ncbi:MAG: hypothetical protein Q9218_003117 [Villophora microphyllina]
MKQEYSLLRFGYHSNHNNTLRVRTECLHAPLLLGSIIDYPDVAYYPTRMSMGSCGDEVYDYEKFHAVEDAEEILFRRQSVVDHHSIRLRTMVDHSNCIEPAVKVKLGNAICRPQNEFAAICLLLTLLPNLVSLDIHDLFTLSLENSFLGIVRRIATANHSPNSSSHGIALSRLRDVALRCNSTQSVELFGPFTALPSIRRLRGFNIHGDTFSWPHDLQPGSSTVTAIRMEYSAVSATALGALFAGIAGLKKFEYQYGGAPRIAAPYEPVGIIHALQMHAGHSLQMLDIEGQVYGEPENWEGKVLWSLRGFTALKSIRLEDTLFQIPYHDDPDEVSISADTTRMSEDRMAPGQLCVMHRLNDVLPASVKGFTLVQLMDDEDSRNLLETFAELKAEKLPNMKRLSFECSNPLEDGMANALKASGVKLFSWKTPI